MSQPTDPEFEDLGIGRKVRDLRQRRRYTLQDLSARTGLPRELLSQVEAGQVMPPVATLLRIARGLDVTVSHFLGQDEPSPERKVAVTRVAERTPLVRRAHHDPTEVGYVYEILELHKSSKRMQPFLVTFQTADKKDMVFYSHEGEECVYLLEGQLEFRSPAEVTTLQPGDCLYFESDISHAFRSVGDRPARALIVVYGGGRTQ